MPPKLPPKKAPKASPKKAAPRKATAPAETAFALTPPTPEVPKKPAPLRFSAYPDLAMAMSMLRVHQRHAGPQKAALLDKWLTMLNKVQTEMTALQNLESLTGAVHKALTPPPTK